MQPNKRIPWYVIPQAAKVVLVLLATMVVPMAALTYYLAQPTEAALASFNYAMHGARSNASQVVSGTYTVPANNIALLWVTTAEGAVPTLVSDSAGRSWQKVTFKSAGKTMTLYQSLSAVPTTGATTITASSPTNWAWNIGYGPYQTITQTAISTFNGYTNFGTASFANAGTGPVVAGVIAHRNFMPFFAGSGFELVGPHSCTNQLFSEICGQMEGRDTFSQTATISWSGQSHYILIAASLGAGNPAPTPTPTPQPTATPEPTPTPNPCQ